MTVFDDEKVIAGAFGHITFRIQHDSFLAPGIICLNLGQNVVEVIERLDRRVQGAMEVPDRGDSNNSHPLLVQLGRIKLDFVRPSCTRRGWLLLLSPRSGTSIAP